jgi:pimeloyl-ACP methyl ester carboxylesterase
VVTLRRLLALLLAVAASTVGVPAVAHAQPAATRYSGTLPNGATWIADVPANWNRTILLYSHGYTPGPANPPRNSPNQPAADALLARGYALAGSSYSRPGWALSTAADDQLATLAAVRAVTGPPRHVIAVGTSMGGLVTGQLAERGGPHLDGALATCGIMGGGIDLHNSQLDGLHALNQLLVPGRQVKLVRFASFAEAVATVQSLTAAVQQAQATPQGRARIALASALLQVPGWYAGLPKPAERDYDAQEIGQYRGLLDGLFRFETGRFDVEQSAGGNISWNAGVNYWPMLAESDRADQVRALYRRAGLDLRTDVRLLTTTADVVPDPAAVAWMKRTSTLNGSLRMPVLTIHTTNDPLVAVEHEEEYAEDVRRAGDNRLLRQAYTDHPGHCTFTTAELVAGVETVRTRIETGRWNGLTTARRLQALAMSLDLGPAAFVRFRPGEFLSDRSVPRPAAITGGRHVVVHRAGS